MQNIFETFRRLFPTTNVIVDETEMRYRFRNPVTAKYFESMAQEIILANGLPLVAALNIWKSGGVINEICLVVEEVPEEHLIIR